MTMAGSGDRDERGFTLIELLIAMFIFAIVISSVYGAYRATFTIIHGSEAQMAISRSGQVAIERISDDLRSIVAGPGGELRGEKKDVSGARGDSLAFISASHLALSKKDLRAGYAVIGYSAEPDEKNGLLKLYRLDRVLLPGMEKEKSETPGDILAAGLQEVSFTYVDADGKETDEWDSEEGKEDSGEGKQLADPLLPELVYVKLVFSHSAERETDQASEGGVVFRTAVALPKKAKARK